MAVLSAQHLKKDYGEVNVIADLNFEVEEGDFTVLVGPSGCGKSTLLRMIAGLEEISGGELLIDGKKANNQHPRERGISMVFQSYALYPHMTVFDNIGFGLKLEGQSKKQIADAVHEVADKLQLDELLQRKPAQLSGGQRQRVAIGRAIVRKPKIILFDEPLSNLDAKLRVEMRMELMKFHRNHNITSIYVTHDQVEAMTMADKIAVMEKGNIRQFDSSKNLFERPENPFVAGFIGSPQMNLFNVSTLQNGVVTSDQGASVMVDQALDPNRLDKAKIIGVRPEHLKLSKSPSGMGFMAEVDLVESLGDETIVHFIAGEQRVTGRFYQPTECAIGDKVHLGFAPESVHLFDQSDNRII